MNAIERFDETAIGHAAATAVVWGTGNRCRSISFGDLADRSRRLATLFARSGLQRGDTALVLLPLGPTFLAVTAALLRSGIAAVFIDPAQWHATLQGALAGFRVRAMIGTIEACMLRWILPRLRSIPLAFVDGRFPGARALADASALPPEERTADCNPDAVAFVSFTSGTTGVPKAVSRTHGTLAAMQRILEHEIGITEGEIHLSTLPFAVLAQLAAGATCVIADMRDKRSAAQRIASQIRLHGVEVIVASPAIAEQLTAEAPGSFESVRRVFIGGAPVFPRLLDSWSRAAPSACVTIIYGMTEAEPITILRASDYGDLERRATRAGAGLLVGLPVKGVDVRIAPQCQDARFAAPREEGEVCVSGPHVSSCFVDPSGGRKGDSVADGRRWLHTGDAGYFDEGGRLWLTGRCRDGVALNGSTIYPLRVEAALAEDHAIARGAFLHSGGQRIVVIEPRERDSSWVPEAIAASVDFAAPEAMAVIDHVPLDLRHGAKVDYRRLGAAVAAGRVREWHRFETRTTVRESPRPPE